jgi:hypothetical protein
MKNSIRIAIFFVLLTSLFMSSSVLAANVTSYTSGFQVQNLSSTDIANLSIKFYNRSDGSLAATQSASIPVGGSSSFFTLSAVSVGFDGSVVIESDQPVVASSLLYGNTTEHIGAYDGFSSGATSLYIPLTQKNNYGVTSFLNVQNTGSSDAHVTVNFPGTYTGNPCAQTATIKPNAAARFDQATNSCLPDGFRAATITSDQPVVTVIVQIQTNYGSAKAGILASGGFTSGSTNPIFPLVSSGWYGSITGIQIQNTGTLPTDVTVTYTPSPAYPGASCTETKTINVGVSRNFALSTNNLLPQACRTTQGSFNAFVGSARVTGNTASQPLVAIANQISSINAQSAAYNALDPATATTAVSFPIIADRLNGSFSGFSVVNMGSSSALITCTYTDSLVTQFKTVAPGGSFTPTQNNKIAASYIGSATCTSTQPILGVANYLDNGTITGALDGLGTYEGINH